MLKIVNLFTVFILKAMIMDDVMQLAARCLNDETVEIVNLFTAFILKAMYGGVYAYWHVANDGTRKVFWTSTMEDAMQLAACCLNDETVEIVNLFTAFILKAMCLNDETVKIVRYDGELVAMRYAC